MKVRSRIYTIGVLSIILLIGCAKKSDDDPSGSNNVPKYIITENTITVDGAPIGDFTKIDEYEWNCYHNDCYDCTSNLSFGYIEPPQGTNTHIGMAGDAYFADFTVLEPGKFAQGKTLRAKDFSRSEGVWEFSLALNNDTNSYYAEDIPASIQGTIFVEEMETGGEFGLTKLRLTFNNFKARSTLDTTNYKTINGSITGDYK